MSLSQESKVFTISTGISKYPTVIAHRLFHPTVSVVDVFDGISTSPTVLFRIVLCIPSPRIIVYKRDFWHHRSWIQKIVYELFCNQWGHYDALTYDQIIQYGSIEQGLSITPLQPIASSDAASIPSSSGRRYSRNHVSASAVAR